MRIKWMVLSGLALLLVIPLIITLNADNIELTNTILGALYAAVAGLFGLFLQQIFHDKNEKEKRIRFVIQLIFEVKQNIELLETLEKNYTASEQTVDAFFGFNVGHLERFKQIRESLFDFSYESFKKYQFFIDFLKEHEMKGRGTGIMKSELIQKKQILNDFLVFLNKSEKNEYNFSFKD